MASEKIINQKKEEVSKLAAKIKEAKIVLLTDYRGINVADVTGLRAELRKSMVRFSAFVSDIPAAYSDCIFQRSGKNSLYSGSQPDGQ